MKPLSKRQLPEPLMEYIGDTSLWWIEEDRGAWGAVSNGPIAELERHGKQWVELCKNKRTVVQAGGNCGAYPRFYSYFFQNVHTFEPDPDNFACLTKNLYRVDNITAHNCGLGSENKKVHFDRNTHTNVGAFRVVDNPTGFEIDVKRLDDFGLENVDLIHLDVEMYERQVLEGAQETIERCRPILIMEHDNCDELLAKLRYKHKYHYHDHVFVPEERYDET